MTASFRGDVLLLGTRHVDTIGALACGPWIRGVLRKGEGLDAHSSQTPYTGQGQCSCGARLAGLAQLRRSTTTLLYAMGSEWAQWARTTSPTTLNLQLVVMIGLGVATYRS